MYSSSRALWEQRRERFRGQPEFPKAGWQTTSGDLTLCFSMVALSLWALQKSRHTPSRTRELALLGSRASRVPMYWSTSPGFCLTPAHRQNHCHCFVRCVEGNWTHLFPQPLQTLQAGLLSRLLGSAYNLSGQKALDLHLGGLGGGGGKHTSLGSRTDTRQPGLQQAIILIIDESVDSLLIK